jgi:predicted secreted protein
MTVTTALATYFIVWWVVLFAVLPFGVRSQAENGDVSPGTDPGAPALPRLLAKLLTTTFIAAVVFAAGAWVYSSGLINLEVFDGWAGLKR